ncbi:MAG: hypothetical protein ABIJ48_04665 [Actinomycetota bacterium]
MSRRTIGFAAAALLALLLPTVAAGAYGGGDYPSNGIRGTITDAAGNPIEYIGVRGFKQIVGGWEETYFSWTGANGVYEMPVWGQAVTVKLYFFQKHVTEEEATWRPEWYDDAATLEMATPIVVAVGTWATANAVMAGPGSIAGRVTDVATGAPIEGIRVRAYAADGARTRGLEARCEEPGVLSGPDGYYELAPVRAGNWILEFRDPDKRWADQWSGGGMVEDEAAPVVVTQDAVTMLDAALVPGGGLAVYPVVAESGRVLDGKGGDLGLGEVCVDAFDAGENLVAGRRDTWDWVFVLPAGDYFFRFSDCTEPVEYATTWYPSALEFADAEPITVVAGAWNGTFFISTAGKCAGEAPTIIGTAGDDELVGTGGRDVIVAGKGNDRVVGRGGNDLICLGAGNDIAVGGAGADRVYGDTGNDRIRGGYHSDRLLGGGGNDRLFGGGAGDVLIGGPGVDTLNGGTGPNRCRLGETLVDC